MENNASSAAFQAVILGLVQRQSMHGYELHKAIGQLDGIGLVWTIKQGHLYALLDRLEAAGWVEGKQVPGENRPPRKEYQLTPAGVEQLQQWLAEPVAHGRDLRQELISKVVVASWQNPQTVRQVVSRQREECRDRRQNFSDHYQEARTAGRRADALVWSYRVEQMDAALQWLENCEKELE